MEAMKALWVLGFLGLRLVVGFQNWNVSSSSHFGDVGFGEIAAEALTATATTEPLLVPLTLIQSAASKGAVCLDGTLPGYHFHRGYGSGANSWLIQLEGGGWCNNIRTCVYRQKTRRGSSNYMEKNLEFTAILSNKPEENPDFFNWNRVKVRYCDGASFTGEGYDQAHGLYFRGQRIWFAAMEDLMAMGMRNANQRRCIWWPHHENLLWWCCKLTGGCKELAKILYFTHGCNFVLLSSKLGGQYSDSIFSSKYSI